MKGTDVKPSIFSADDLMKEEITIPKMIVDDILPTGLTVLAGKPKLGKSWMALNLGVAVATDGLFLGRRADQGDVLYLALEDTKRRLQERLRKVLRGPAPRLHLSISCPALDKGGEKFIRDWVSRAAAPRLIIVDVLQKVRPEAKGRTLYDEDYLAVAPLKQIADEHGLAVLVITHTRKADPGFDALDAISATTGLAGAADHNLILDRGSDGLVLYGRGRDTDEFRLGLKFDGERGAFEALGDPSAVHRTHTRNAIIQVLSAAGEGLGPCEIARRAGVDEDNAKKTIRRMVSDGELQKLARGIYAVPFAGVPEIPFGQHNESGRQAVGRGH